MHNTPGNSKVRLGETKTWLPEASGPPLAGSAHLLLMAPVPVLTEGNREPDRTGRVARVMTWSSINSKPGAKIFRDKPK